MKFENLDRTNTDEEKRKSLGEGERLTKISKKPDVGTDLWI